MNPSPTPKYRSEKFDYLKNSPSDIIAALAGNPNVGKSTLFNSLTGMKQHTGNWAGKTVENARGEMVFDGRRVVFADLPGCYSLYSDAAEETAAASFLKSGTADVAVTVCDSLTVERGLLLFLQIRRICPRSVLCINLIDEAKKRGIHIDSCGLSKELGVPVVETSALHRSGISDLLRAVCEVYDNKPRETFADTDPRADAAALFKKYVTTDGEIHTRRDRFFDTLLTGKYTAAPCMLLMLLLIFWITIKGANYPSELLSRFFWWLEKYIAAGLYAVSLPEAAVSFLTEGVYRTVCWVVAVMLPPMAVFFPLFTLAEDAGILPRIAFNLDYPFAKCSACGKQALTMCMGFGCNAVGVTGCRIINSPREKLIAVITNSFMPCNGRFPMILSLSAAFFGGRNGSGFVSAVFLTLFVLVAVCVTLCVSKLLSVTLFKGTPSFFAIEMPPFRKPKIGETIVRSVFDRTLFVLGRAVTAAAPAGAIIWLMANLTAGGKSVLAYISDFLEPIGMCMGLDGEILLGFLMAFPANEIVLPSIIMAYTGGGALAAAPDSAVLGQILAENGWTMLTAVNTILFSLMHWPCATTVKTIKKETGSIKYTILSVLIPTVCGFAVCGFLRFITLIFS